MSVDAIGINGAPGLIEERRRNELKIQRYREKRAAEMGLAGPHGEPLTVEEFRLASNKKSGVLNVVQKWMDKMQRKGDA